MSTLHHESILEDCLVEAEENFRVSNKLTQKQLDELLVRSEGVRDAITKQAERLFEDRCIYHLSVSNDTELLPPGSPVTPLKKVSGVIVSPFFFKKRRQGR